MGTGQLRAGPHPELVIQPPADLLVGREGGRLLAAGGQSARAPSLLGSASWDSGRSTSFLARSLT